MELGYHLDAGLEIGQLEDARYVEQAARDVVRQALDAMRDEADAHSPSGEGVRIGKDILKGLERWTPMTGTPQGAVISPLLANIYLHLLDELMARRGYRMVRMRTTSWF